MTSPTHQDFVLFFRSHPELTFELARRARVPLGHDYDHLELFDGEFDDPMNPGKSVRADVVLIGWLRRQKQRGLVFEVQLGDSTDKEWSMLAYRAGLRRLIRRPAWTVLFSPDAQVRRKMRKRFREEPEIRPRMITPRMIPDIRDFDTALSSYPWAVLSAAMHAKAPHAVARALVAIQALLRLRPPEFERYIQLVSSTVGARVMQQVRQQIPQGDRVQLSALERRGGSFVLGLEEGREEGREEGVDALHAALLGVLEARELVIDARVREQIAACQDLEQLRDWIVRAATIQQPDELL